MAQLRGWEVIAKSDFTAHPSFTGTSLLFVFPKAGGHGRSDESWEACWLRRSVFQFRSFFASHPLSLYIHVLLSAAYSADILIVPVTNEVFE